MKTNWPAIIILFFISTCYWGVIERQNLPVDYSNVEVMSPKKQSSKKFEIIKLIANNPSNEVKIREIARELNFKWPGYLVKLLNCESGLNEKAINEWGNHPSTSKDRGIAQFNSYWRADISDKCSFDLDCSVRETIKMINKGYQNRWACNKIVLNKK